MDTKEEKKQTKQSSGEGDTNTSARTTWEDLKNLFRMFLKRRGNDKKGEKREKCQQLNTHKTLTQNTQAQSQTKHKETEGNNDTRNSELCQ